eukprot:6203079-Pleurochrysis_carterae.AAC.1
MLFRALLRHAVSRACEARDMSRFSLYRQDERHDSSKARTVESEQKAALIDKLYNFRKVKAHMSTRAHKHVNT